jgi:putative heme-binding domain-containing protein
MIKLAGSALVIWLAGGPSGWAATADTGMQRGVRNLEEYRHFALLHEGDPFRGKALFADDQKTLCSKCHTVDGSARKAGPDLFAVGDKFGRGDIIASVLRPSETIAVGYNTTTVETKSGEEYSGIIKQATDEWIELMGADGNARRITTEEISERQTSEVSLMPEGLQAGLTLQGFTDLIEYLVSLKQAASTAMLEHGMPSDILQVAKPVRLIPFHSTEIKFEHPVWFGPVPGDSNAFLVVEHETGKIWRLEKHASGDEKTLFAELGQSQKGTRGLLGMAIHPRFQENRRYFFAKHLVENGKFATYIFAREAAADFRTDSGLASQLILKIEQATGNHYGGGFQFGPDEYFYVGMGDGGPQEDPQGHGQDLRLLIGKMLRIDVNHAETGRPYAVPADNPFVGNSAVRPEIWAAGLREPWRFSFDPLTRDLWVGDVGQDRYEEVNIVRPGENYGWNVYEGFEPFSNQYRKEDASYVPPVFAYGRKFGVSVTGGYVYRANPKSPFYGVYIFGDYQSQRIWGLTQENRRLKRILQIGTAPQRIVSFGRDHVGELYLVGYEGMIYKIDFDGCVFE